MLINTKIKGKILLKSGMHIGGMDDGVKIGGIDSPVIKNPLSKEPYIPGSSLKGKMRFLLEHRYGVAENNGGNIPKYDEQNNLIPVVFGHTQHDSYETFPTRIIVRDSNIIGAILNYNINKPENEKMIGKEKAHKMMMTLFSENKPEVAINRKSGTVISPRFMERVPAGVVFEFEIILRSFDQNEKEKHLNLIIEGLQLVENDALGGMSSRGSGRIKFYDLKIDNKAIDFENYPEKGV